jgi:hypothetical protein
MSFYEVATLEEQKGLIYTIAIGEAPWGGCLFPALFTSIVRSLPLDAAVSPSELLHFLERMHQDGDGVELVERLESGNAVPISPARLVELGAAYDTWLDRDSPPG